MTGKSNIEGGVKYKEKATGSGVYYSIKTLLESKKFKNIRETY